MADDDLTRCFIAVELSREAINYVKDIQALIKKQNLFYGKFTESENLHLTLKFLGEIDEGMLDDARARLKKIESREFEAELDEVGVFSKKFLKLVWIKLKGADKLQKEVDKALEGLFDLQQRFMGHITIARVKSVPDRRKFLDYLKTMKTKKIKFKVDKFFFKKSELAPEGPTYSNLEECKLSK